MTRLLVIDADHDLAHRLAAALRRKTREVAEVRTREEALLLALAPLRRPDLVVLGLGTSNCGGFQLLEELRKGGFHGPVLVYSTSREEGQVVRAFRLGADQFLTLPFGEAELLARVDSLLDRAQARGMEGMHTDASSTTTHRYMFGSVVVDPVTHQVYRSGKPVKLAPLEFDLLVALLRRQGAATTRGELLREVWNYGPDVMSRTLDTHILNLREKLEDEPSTPRHILTVRKLGYRLHAES